MSRVAGISVEGIDDVTKVFEQLLPRDAQNLARSVNHGVASQVAKEAKIKAPKNTGNLKKAIAAKREKSPPDNPLALVYVRSGKKEKFDGFYWRFVEHGTKTAAANPFLQPTIDNIRPQLPSIYREQFVKKLAAMARRKLKKAGR